MCLKYFCNKKGQHGFKSMLSFFTSHEACRRMAAFSIQLTESHTELASRGACCATAVKPRPSRMSIYAPARRWRAVRKGLSPSALPRGCGRRLAEECGCR